MILVTVDICIILVISPNILGGLKKTPVNYIRISYYSTQICFHLRIIKKELECTKICMHKCDVKWYCGLTVLINCGLVNRFFCRSFC